jgi:rare lipoprotein A (peptidoglycan hydrolase)
MGDHLAITYNKRKVVVKVNDRGAGKVVNGVADESRVLDLSRAAYAYLLGKEVTDVTDANAGVIQLELIEKVTKNTPLGPVTTTSVKQK